MGFTDACPEAATGQRMVSAANMYRRVGPCGCITTSIVGDE
jgi:hypothetical protein